MQEIIMAGAGALVGAGSCWALLAAAPQLNPLSQRRTLVAAEEELKAAAHQQWLESEQNRKEAAAYDRREIERACAEQLGRALQIATDTEDPVQGLRAWLAEYDGADAQQAVETKAGPRVPNPANLDLDQIMDEIQKVSSEMDDLMVSQPERIRKVYELMSGPMGRGPTDGQIAMRRELHAIVTALNSEKVSQMSKIATLINIAQLQCAQCAFAYMNTVEVFDYDHNPHRIVHADTEKIQNRMPLPIRKRFQYLKQLSNELTNRA